MPVTLLIIMAAALALFTLGYLIWKPKKFPAAKQKNDIAGQSGIHAVERITAKFPGMTRHSSKQGNKNGGAILALQGNLAQTPLPDLLQYLALGHKTGILEITCGRRTGRVVMNEGRVAKYFYRGKEGLEAIFMMMDLTEGDFEFSEQALEEMDSKTMVEVVDVIMLWMDRKPKKKPSSK